MCIPLVYVSPHTDILSHSPTSTKTKILLYNSRRPSAAILDSTMLIKELLPPQTLRLLPTSTSAETIDVQQGRYRRQQTVPTNTDPNFMLHGQSPPVHFTHGGIQYLSPPNPYSVPWYTQQAQNQIYRPQRASPPPSQSSPILAFNLDDDNFKPLWASASQSFQPYSEGPSQSVENDSPVEEVEPVQPKRKYTRRSKPTKKNDKEFVEPWTIEEEIALCKAFVAKSEDSVQGNGKKVRELELKERKRQEQGELKRLRIAHCVV
ncbi:hypothetical protein Tco_0579499 [Tanacetum coccineum]